MSAKAASSKKITANVGKNSNQQKSLKQTKMFSPTSKAVSHKQVSEAPIDLTLNDSDHEIGGAIVAEPP